MITQKEALINLLSGLPHDFRLQFVYNWLEDINWHNEATLLASVAFNDPAKMEWLELVKYANDPAGYNYKFVQEQLKKLTPGELASLVMIKESSGVKSVNGTLISSMDLYYMRRAENYSPFSYIFGWGLNNKDWNATAGQPFVDELLQIINEGDLNPNDQ